ncbi:hypothetical protein [Rhizobium sp. MHM7A]|uniref:hypothetical protein n=1 Tax=Rhizobium sp. MHM7A TaxID=2583233 RepID=UPI0011066570|nr:hypothetical protein [Rhizobium sp. MHM7A]TLX16962.1 hypothetical protein FFR93_06455 [Rhizobium sp. MHM7A]
MIYDELLRECAIALDDMKLKPKLEQNSDEQGVGETIRFYNELGNELTVYVEADPDSSSLLGTVAFHWDYAETITNAGDVFRVEKNLESTQINSYVQFCNILWAHRHQFKSKLSKGTREFHDEDLLALIMELERQRIPHELQIVNHRPRISFTRHGEEIASARKSAGRLRYQDTTGEVTSSKGTEGEALKEFISAVVNDLRPKITEIKKFR